MVELMDASNVTPDNIVRPAFENLPAEEQETFKNMMAQAQEDLKKRFLEGFTMDRHKKITKEKEVTLNALLPSTSSPAPNVSNPKTAPYFQSIKGYVDQGHIQLSNQLEALKTSIDELVRAQGKSTASTFPTHEHSVESIAPSPSAPSGS